MSILRKLFYKIPFLPWFYHFIWALAGAIIYRFPSRKVFVIGITGTKGKTTVVELLNFILERADYRTAALSSVIIKLSRLNLDNLTGNTMPGRFFIQKFLRRAVDSDCRYALVEVTSEGVKLGRHRFINWGGAVFLNIHPEHIEAHGSFEKYRNAKLDFFRYVKKIQSSKIKTFFVNKDDESAKYFVEAVFSLPSGVTSSFGAVSSSPGAALPSPAVLPSSSAQAEDPYPLSSSSLTGESTFLDSPAKRGNDKEDGSDNLVVLFGKSDLPSNLIGEFNRYNIGAAVAVARELRVDEDVIRQAVAEFPGVPGRMEFIQKEPFVIIIDYAHTSDSLQQVYETLRQAQGDFADGKVICVLGSAGGGRDKWKRPEMGKIAAEYCDEIILTNEDPYDEQPEKIIEEIFSGCSQVQSSKFKVQKIVNRKEAIEKAVSLAALGDVVVITGKGSERFIHTAGGKKIPWSDKRVVLDILRKNI